MGVTGKDTTGGGNRNKPRGANLTFNDSFFMYEVMIKEPDWKTFRQLRPLALERLCQRILEEIESINADCEKSYHQRYMDIFKVIEQQDKEISLGFDESRRSNALTQLVFFRSRNLLTEVEFERFSAETRSVIGFLAGDGSD
jgi:hypothetical protein